MKAGARVRDQGPIGIGVAVLAIAAGLAAATPASAQADAPAATIRVSGPDQPVTHGRRVRLEGKVSPAGPGIQVVVEFARRGGKFWLVARATSRADGTYSLTVLTTRSGAFRAFVSGGRVSPVARVAIASRLSAHARSHAAAGEVLRVAGRIRPAVRGRSVALELLAGGDWRRVARARTAAGGRFVATWRPEAAGNHRLRVRFRGDRWNSGATSELAREVAAYRPSAASWYGPGLYGNRLACGGRLTPGTLGVAHKFLPCGTLVTFRYRGRVATVPIVDRGPYVGGREWDLTAATKQALGFRATGRIWWTRGARTRRAQSRTGGARASTGLRALRPRSG